MANSMTNMSVGCISSFCTPEGARKMWSPWRILVPPPVPVTFYKHEPRVQSNEMYRGSLLFHSPNSFLNLFKRLKEGKGISQNNIPNLTCKIFYTAHISNWPGAADPRNGSNGRCRSRPEQRHCCQNRRPRPSSSAPHADCPGALGGARQ